MLLLTNDKHNADRDTRLLARAELQGIRARVLQWQAQRAVGDRLGLAHLADLDARIDAALKLGTRPPCRTTDQKSQYGARKAPFFAPEERAAGWYGQVWTVWTVWKVWTIRDHRRKFVLHGPLVLTLEIMNESAAVARGRRNK